MVAADAPAGTDYSQLPYRLALLTSTRSVPEPPAITTQPASVAGVIGGSAAFTVVASGSGNTYQWRSDGGPIAGATGPTLTLTNLTQAQAGNYTVVVTNPQGSVTSAAATLTLVSAANVGRLVNMSIRSHAGSGERTLIVGLGLGGRQSTCRYRQAEYRIAIEPS